jgi:hypothetical protein
MKKLASQSLRINIGNEIHVAKLKKKNYIKKYSKICISKFSIFFVKIEIIFVKELKI